MPEVTQRFFGESLSGNDVKRRLRAALRLPSQSRKVADWLFDVYEHNFRVDSSTVSPDCFASALAIVSESFSELPDESERLRLPQDGKGKDDEIYSKAFVVFIPAEERDGIILGYSFHIGTPVKQDMFPICEVLRQTYANVGRFAFDKLHSEVLLSMVQSTPTTSLVCTLNWFEGALQQTMYFSVPFEEYGYGNLPSRVIGLSIHSQWMLASCTPNSSVFDARGDVRLLEAYPTPCTDSFKSINDGSRDCAVGDDSVIHSSGMWGDDEVNHLDMHLLDSFETLESSKCENQFTCDELGVSFSDVGAMLGPAGASSEKEGRSEGLSGWYKQTMIAEWMTELAGCLLGEFRTRLTRWMTPVSVDQMDSTKEWDMWREVQEVGVSERSILQKFAARSYYADTLGVSTDMRLRPVVIAPEDAEEERDARDTFA